MASNVMNKVICLFADGTGNAFSTQESNVWRNVMAAWRSYRNSRQRSFRRESPTIKISRLIRDAVLAEAAAARPGGLRHGQAAVRPDREDRIHGSVRHGRGLRRAHRGDARRDQLGDLADQVPRPQAEPQSPLRPARIVARRRAADLSPGPLRCDRRNQGPHADQGGLVRRGAFRCGRRLPGRGLVPDPTRLDAGRDREPSHVPAGLSARRATRHVRSGARPRFAQRARGLLSLCAPNHRDRHG